MPPVPPRRPRSRSPDGLDRVALHRATPWVVLTVSLLTCLLGWYHGDRTMRRRAEERFVHHADEASARLQEQLARYEDVLRGAAAFARSTPALDLDAGTRTSTVWRCARRLPGWWASASRPVSATKT